MQKPILLKGQNQIIFGIYPNTVVSDEKTIQKLNEFYNTKIMDYYEFDNNYYVKIISSPWSKGHKFENGNEMISQNKYWFKVEPILWDIISNDDNIYFVRTHEILFQYVFDENNKFYKDSKLLLYLNKDFYNKAFLDGENCIEYSVLDYGETSEKLFLLSEEECSFQNNEQRLAKPTDYAKALGCWISECGYSDYWLRTEVDCDNDANVKIMSDDGKIWMANKDAFVGVVVAAKIKL